MENISKHITYEEATFSETAKAHNIDNTPNEDQLLFVDSSLQARFYLHLV